MSTISQLGKKILSIAVSISLLTGSPAWAMLSVPGAIGRAPVGQVSAGAAGGKFISVATVETGVSGPANMQIGGSLPHMDHIRVSAQNSESAQASLRTPIMRFSTQDDESDPIKSGSRAAQVVSAASLEVRGQAIERHPVLGILNDLQKAGIPMESMPQTAEEFAALEEAIQHNVPEGKAKRNMMAFAKSLSLAGASGESMARAYDGNGNLEGRYAMPVAEASKPTGFWAWLAGTSKGNVIKRGWFGLKKIAARKAEEGRKKTPLIEKDALKVPVEKLRWVPKAEELPEKLSDLKGGPSGIVGQDSALEAIRFGLQMQARAYNLIVTGADGTGRATAVRQELRKIAPQMETPKDKVGVTNLQKPSHPIILTLPSGAAPAFQGAVAQFIGQLKQAIPINVLSGEMAAEKEDLQDSLDKMRKDELAKFYAQVAKVSHGRYGLHFFEMENGRFSVAVTVDGKTLNQEQLEEQTKKEAADESIKDKVSQEKLQEALKAMDDDVKRLGKMLQGIINEIFATARQLEAQINQMEAKVAAQVVSQMSKSLVSFTQDEAHAAFAKRAADRMVEVEKKVAQIRILDVFGLKISIMQDGRLSAGPTWEDPAQAAQMAEMLKELRTKMGGAVQLAGTGAQARQISEKEFNQLKEAGQIPQDMTWQQVMADVQSKAKALLPLYQEMSKANQKDRESLPAPSKDSQEVMSYLQMLLSHMARNYQLFMPQQPAQDADPMAAMMAMQERVRPEKLYKVSVLASNKPGSGAPVIFEQKPTFNNLFGKAKDASSISQQGGMMVKMKTPGGPTLQSGSFIRANGGYLVLELKDVLREPGVYQGLMQMIRNGKAVIAENGAMSMVADSDHYDVAAQVKVVLIGSPMLKMMLNQYDEDFAGFFRATAEFESSLKIGADAISGYLKFMRAMVEQSGGKIYDFARGAVAGLFELAANVIESNEKLTAQFGVMRSIMLEASYWARQNGRTIVEREDLDMAIGQRLARKSGMARRIKEMYSSDTFHIAIEGTEVGQINGLAVMGDFGVPARITFENYVRPGANFLVSTDQAAKSTGNSFDKSIANIRGFMGRTFGRNRTVPIEVSISFEQNYGGIDGDSATQTMIYGMLSSLSGKPIKQGIAITGSTDQKGNVQVIGGVNHKIEGYFDVVVDKLKSEGRELDGEQGIIIPTGNVKDLSLRPDIVEAVKAGKFTIYAVDHISQGVEILMDTPYSEVLKAVEGRIAQVRSAATDEAS